MVGTNGIISTVAGQGGVFGNNGENVLATQARLNGPMGVEIDPDENLWISDTSNNLIRVVYK